MTRPISSASAALVAAAQEPDLLGLAVADQPREQPDPEPGVEAADLRADLAEDRVVAGDREVAHDLEDLAATDGVAVDERDDRDRQRPDLALEVEDVEPRQPVAADVAAAVLEALVAARAERPVAGAGQQRRSRSTASSRIRANASIISATVSGRKALWTSGRSIVTRAIPVPECS